MLVILALGRFRQEAHCEFQAILDYIANPVSNKNKNNLKYRTCACSSMQLYLVSWTP